MNVIPDFKEIVRQYVAPHRRQPHRLNWLWALTDLDSVWASFSAWRDYYRYKVHVTSQHKSLQGHLTKMFGSGTTIRVKSYDDEFLDVGLDSEPAHWIIFAPYEGVALEGESERTFEDVDFVVYVPSGISAGQVEAEIERYKLADKKYRIIQRV